MMKQKNFAIICFVSILSILIANPVFAITYTASISPTTLTLEWGQSQYVYTSVTNNNFWYSINCQSSLDGSSWSSAVRINAGQSGSVPILITAQTTGTSTTTIGITTKCVSDDTNDAPVTFVKSITLSYPTQEQLNAYNSLTSAQNSINDANNAKTSAH